MFKKFILFFIFFAFISSSIIQAQPSVSANNEEQSVSNERKLRNINDEIDDIVERQKQKDSNPLDVVFLEKQSKLNSLKRAVESFNDQINDINMSVMTALGQVSRFST